MKLISFQPLNSSLAFFRKEMLLHCLELGLPGVSPTELICHTNLFICGAKQLSMTNSVINSDMLQLQLPPVELQLHRSTCHSLVSGQWVNWTACFPWLSLLLHSSSLRRQDEYFSSCLVKLGVKAQTRGSSSDLSGGCFLL